MSDSDISFCDLFAMDELEEYFAIKNEEDDNVPENEYDANIHHDNVDHDDEIIIHEKKVMIGLTQCKNKPNHNETSFSDVRSVVEQSISDHDDEQLTIQKKDDKRVSLKGEEKKLKKIKKKSKKTIKKKRSKSKDEKKLSLTREGKKVKKKTKKSKKSHNKTKKQSDSSMSESTTLNSVNNMLTKKQTSWKYFGNELKEVVNSNWKETYRFFKVYLSRNEMKIMDESRTIYKIYQLGNGFDSIDNIRDDYSVNAKPNQAVLLDMIRISDNCRKKFLDFLSSTKVYELVGNDSSIAINSAFSISRASLSTLFGFKNKFITGEIIDNFGIFLKYHMNSRKSQNRMKRNLHVFSIHFYSKMVTDLR